MYARDDTRRMGRTIPWLHDPPNARSDGFSRKTGLKIPCAYPIDRLVSTDDLSDDQIWTICLAIMPGLPNMQDYLMHRDGMINLFRELFDDARIGLTVSMLEDLVDRLTLGGEHKLASLMQKWRQERQSLN